MKPYSLALFAILIFGLFFVFPISAVTVSGDLTGMNYSQSSYANGGVMAGGNNFQRWYVNSIEFNTNLKSFVIFDQYQINSYDAGASAGETTSFTLRTTSLSGPIIATGTMGYQRIWNTAVPPVEQFGYVWFVFDNGWNTTGLSGDTQNIYCNFSAAAVRNVTRQGVGSTRLPPADGNIEMCPNAAATYLETYETQMATHYTATQPGGLGITGNATKAAGTTSRVYIINPSTGATITSEGTQTNTLFNFNVLNTGVGIIIAAQDAKGNFYNTSTLLTGGLPTTTPTPTPTGPTPIPTGAPGTETNITLTAKYGINSTAIPNVFVKIFMYYEGGPKGDDDWHEAVDGYTDVNGQITFAGVSLANEDFRVEFTKPGLYQLGGWIDPTPYTWAQTWYMYAQPPGSGIPGVPAQVNVTVQVKQASDYAVVPNAWVTIGDSTAGTAYVGMATNATGYAYFPGVPNSASLGGQITKTGYIPLTYWISSGALLDGDVQATKYVYLTSSTATPTITPVPQNAVTLIASPNSVNPGDQVAFTTSCANVTACTGPNGLHLVTYHETLPQSWTTNIIAVYHYNTTSAGWDYRPNSASPWQVGSFNPLTGARARPSISGTYDYRVILQRNDYFNIGQGTAPVVVSGAVGANLNMRLSAGDQTTGGHLSNYQMNLTQIHTGNVTEWGTVAYDKFALLPRGGEYTVMCSKPGYLDGSNDFIVPMNPNIIDGDMGTFVNCPLYPTGSISAGNTTVSVKVFDAENYLPLGGVTVQMSAPVIYSDSPKYTGGDGAGVFFILGQNQEYTVTASKTGYCAVTDTGNTSTLDTKNVYMNLKYGSCLGPTPTHTPTPGPTGTGTGIVTPTPFQPGNATTFWRPWINVFTYMGANMSEINMLIAGLIIVLLMAAGAGMAGVLGAEVAMGFGAIFCVAIGLIPIWVVLAIIILGFLFYGLKIGR